jgi:hypothetical protein
VLELVPAADQGAWFGEVAQDEIGVTGIGGV